jgi:hypothetical protein
VIGDNFRTAMQQEVAAGALIPDEDVYKPMFLNKIPQITSVNENDDDSEGVP